jgi:hypothetical protein
MSAAALEQARLLLAGGADEQALYHRWFHRETGALARWPGAAAYRAASLRSTRFERGWAVLRVLERPAGAVVVMRGGRERVLAPPEMCPADPRCLSLAPGMSVLVEPTAAGEAGGFWHLWSAGWQAAAPRRMQRLYLQVNPARALLLAEQVASRAPPRPVWALKVLCGSHEAGRRDRALLYLPAQTKLRTPWVASVVQAAQACCDGEPDDLPPLVSRLAPGLGHAPDPGGGRSFGQAVCAALHAARHVAQDARRFEPEAGGGVGGAMGWGGFGTSVAV